MRASRECSSCRATSPRQSRCERRFRAITIACRCPRSEASAARAALTISAPTQAERHMFKDGLLKGKRILITGGGTGLGKEIAAQYLALGADLWIAGRRGPVLDETAKELMAKHGGSVRTHSIDIRD